jgi:aldose 1-epimerase
MFQIQQISTSNPLEDHFHITNEGISCKIYQNLGASVQEFSKNGVALFKGFRKVEDYKIEHTSSILAPFPGRIEYGTYIHDHKKYHLDTNENNRENSIHGLVAHEYFECTDSKSTEDQATIVFSYQPKNNIEGYPFLYKVDVTYLITNNSLHVDIRMKNLDETIIPFGLGWHPYFLCSDLKNSMLQFNSTQEILCDTEMIPISEKSIDYASAFPIKDLHFDTCYTLDQKKVSLKTNEYSVDMEVFSPEDQFIQIFTPHTRDCIALEPMTCAPNAFNNRMGLLQLKPKDSYTYSIMLNFTTNV